MSAEIFYFEFMRATRVEFVLCCCMHLSSSQLFIQAKSPSELHGGSRSHVHLIRLQLAVIRLSLMRATLGAPLCEFCSHAELDAPLQAGAQRSGGRKASPPGASTVSLCGASVGVPWERMRTQAVTEVKSSPTVAYSRGMSSTSYTAAGMILYRVEMQQDASARVAA